MTSEPYVPVGELMRQETASIDPRRFPNEDFDLYSIPAYDTGKADVVPGEAIGSAKQIVEPNDVLLSRIVPHIRRAWVVGPRNGHRQIASGEWIIFRKKNVHPQYLRHVLLGDDFHARFMMTVAGVGGSLMRARPKHVAEIAIPLPSPPEQRRIAAILDQADALRAKRRAALALLDEMAQAIFVDMFGHPITNPRGWPTAPLARLGAISTGGTPPGTLEGMFGVDVPFVTPGDLGAGASAKRMLSKAGAETVRVVRQGATLVCCIGATIGKMDIARTTCAFNQQINAVEWFDTVDDFFGLGTLSFYKQRISELGASTTLPILKKSSFSQISIPVPDYSLQVHYSHRVKQVGSVRQLMATQLAGATDLFASLQHRAFRGEL